MAFKRKNVYRVEVTWTPLIDMVLLLLIFFLVATTFGVREKVHQPKPVRNPSEIEILPRAYAKKELEKDFDLLIGIEYNKPRGRLLTFNNKGAPIYFYQTDSVRVDVPSLSFIERLIEDVAASEAMIHPKVVIWAHRYAPYGTITRILEKCEREQLTRVSCVVREDMIY
jgi:biopolymer transport protein ExbD